MIRINTAQIKQWEYIKKCHTEYFNKYISVRINTLVHQKGVTYNLAKEFIDNLALTDIAIGEIRYLKKYLVKYNKAIATLRKNCSDKQFQKKLEKFNSIIEYVFNYKSFRDNKNNIVIHNLRTSWNRHKLISLMDIRTCPYCNRQFITNYRDTNDNKTTADLDHFYPQSKYPFLALSLYNFVPSCQICNSRFKGYQFNAEKHIYPYNEEFGSDAKFMIKARNMDYVWTDTNEFEIELSVKKDCENQEKIENSINTFNIDMVYQIHKDYVQEIVKKAIAYDSEMIKSLSMEYPKMFKSESDIWQCIMANYLTEEQLGNRPLAKLCKDISEQFGIKL
jgi:5-methylcytosine-specific restriction endonuclease McrA